MSGAPTIDEKFEALFEEATNPRQRESLMRIKRACDYLQESGVGISPTTVERYCLDHQWDGPKAQSIRNSRDVLYRYLKLRQATQKVDRPSRQKEYTPAIQDETLRAYVELLKQERDLAFAARNRIEAAIRTIPGVSIDEIIRVGFGASPDRPPPAPRRGMPELLIALVTLMNPAQLSKCGLEVYKERVRCITSKHVLLEKSHVEAIRELIEEMEGEKKKQD